MRAYLSGAAILATVAAWLMSGSGHEGASEARDARAGLDLRGRVPDPFPEPASTASLAVAEAAPEPPGSGREARPAEGHLPGRPVEGLPAEAAPRRAVRIVYPPPFEVR